MFSKGASTLSSIRRDAHLLEALRYIALNPVRAGITPTAEVGVVEPSSYGRTPEPPSWLAVSDVHALFAANAAHYVEFIARGVEAGRPNLGALVTSASASQMMTARHGTDIHKPEIAPTSVSANRPSPESSVSARRE